LLYLPMLTLLSGSLISAPVELSGTYDCKAVAVGGVTTGDHGKWHGKDLAGSNVEYAIVVKDSGESAEQVIDTATIRFQIYAVTVRQQHVIDRPFDCLNDIGNTASGVFGLRADRDGFISCTDGRKRHWEFDLTRSKFVMIERGDYLEDVPAPAPASISVGTCAKR
jgi:hypothetical protein